MMHDDHLQVDNLTVSFSRWGQNTEALRGLSFSVPLGQWVLLVGANGAGKSVCLRAISGWTKLSQGVILVGGRPVTRMSPSEVAENIFYVHQDPVRGTAPTLTVYENLTVADHGANQRRESKKILMEKYAELIAPIGLSDRLNQPVKTLSGGERQLLTIIIAGLRPSGLILLDEPTAALDPRRSDLCLELIARLHKQGKTIVQITHDERSSASVGERTIVLSEGRVAYDTATGPRTLNAIRKHWFNNLNGNNGDA